MRDAQVRHVAVVNDVDRLVAAISIDHLVLVAQNVGAGADAANIVRFHAFSRMGRRGRGIRQSVQIRRRGRSSVCGGPGRLRGAACGDQRHAQTGRCAVLGHRVATLPTYLPTYLPPAGGGPGLSGDARALPAPAAARALTCARNHRATPGAQGRTGAGAPRPAWSWSSGSALRPSATTLSAVSSARSAEAGGHGRGADALATDL